VVAFVTSVLVSAVLFGIGVLYMNRRPADQKGTWGESMVGAVYVFGTLFWIFGVVPHQFILWADSDLGWRVDRFLVGPGAILDNLPFVIPYSAIRDIMVVNIHVVYVVGWVIVWKKWQLRGKAEPVAAETITSDYGRPLVKADA
jgi:hypothetical protein